MNAVRKYFIAILSAAILTACVGETVQVSSSAPLIQKEAFPVKGEACGFQLCHFIPIGINSRLSRAYGDLQEKAPGATLTDIKLQETWLYGVVGTVYCSRLQAMAVPKE